MGRWNSNTATFETEICHRCKAAEESLDNVSSLYDGLCDDCGVKERLAADARLRIFRMELAEAQFKYPKACKICRGAGWFYFAPRNEDPGDSSPCSECLEKGVCPRCGKNQMEKGGLVMDDETGSSACGCGYNDSDSKTSQPVIPEPPEF